MLHFLPLQLAFIDYSIIGAYFAAVLGIGFVLKRRMRASLDFLLAGRAIPAWAAGLAFIAANLGAQEVIDMAASGAKYGWLTSHFYWIGAIPAMAFVAVFMMPFYYGSRARSVPEYLRHASILLSALVVLGYILLGGLTSAIYNEVLQFFLIVVGFTPLV